MATKPYNGKGRRNGLWLRRQEVRVRERIARTLQKQCNWLVKNISQISTFTTQTTNALTISTNTVEHEIERLLDEFPYEEELVDQIIAGMKVSVVKGGQTEVKDLGLKKFGISFTVRSPRAVSLLSEKRDFELSERQGTISYTTRMRIKDILTRGAAEGLSYQDMAKQIRDQAIEGVFSRARSELIAITEVGRAYGSGQYSVARDFLDRFPDRRIEKQWITVGDDQVRPTHTQNEDDGWIDFHELFSGTKELHAPSNDFRCRCSYRERIV